MSHFIRYKVALFQNTLKTYHRHFICSFLFHTVLFCVLTMIYPLRPLIELYFMDTIILSLAVYGSTKQIAWFILPSVISKLICIGACTGVTILSLGETSIKFNTRESRMEFRRQRNYPEPMNVMFEDHPTVCIWIYCILVIAAIDVHVGFRDYYTSLQCYRSAEGIVKDRQLEEKPPEYSVCVTNSSQALNLPTYTEAMEQRENNIEMHKISRRDLNLSEIL